MTGHHQSSEQTTIGKQTMTTEDSALDDLLRTLVSPPSDDHLRHIFNKGATAKQLAAASGRAQSWVDSRLQATGVDLRGCDHGLYMRLWRSLSPKSDDNELRRAYEAGVSAGLMCAALEIDWPTLRERLEGAGVRIRPQPRILHPNIPAHLRPLLLALPPDASGAQMGPVYEAGAPVETLATFTDHSRSLVHRLLEKMGIEFRSSHIIAKKNLPTTAADLLAELSPNATRKQIAATYAEGASTLQIAERVGVHPSTVGNWLKQHGATLRPPGHVKPSAPALSLLHRDSTAEELKAVYLQKATIPDLAKATGRSTSWVDRQLHHVGTPMRPPATTSQEALAQEASPLVAQQKLAQRLMTLRSGAGLTQNQLAEGLGVGASMILRSEAFPGKWSPTFLRALGAYYNLSEQEQQALLQLRTQARTQGWWAHQGLAMPAEDLIRVGLRGDVRQVYGWALNLVPELVQTTEYAQAIESQFRPSGQTDQAQATIALLTALQRRVRRRGIVQRYVVDESVLRRRVGDTALMVRQLEALAVLARRGRLRVLAHFGPMPGVYEGFELCTIPGLDEPVVYFPQRRQIQPAAPLPFGHTLESLQHVMKRLWESAANPQDSQALIEQARARMLPGAASAPLQHQPLFLHGPSARQKVNPTLALTHRSAGEN